MLLHGLLFLATLGTLFAAGATFWATSGATAVGEGVAYALWVAAILLAHEFGHYVACRHHGVPATLPFFVPGIPPVGTFGAVIRIRGRIPHRRALFDIAAAGPIAGFAVAVPALAFGLFRAEPFDPAPFAGQSVLTFGSPAIAELLQPLLRPDSGEITVNAWYGAGWVGMLVTSLNLFPVGQLDGGHAAYAVSSRAHRWLSRITPLALLALVALQSIVLEAAPAYLVWIAILLWMRDRHPPLLDDSMPLGRGRKFVAVALAVLFALSFIALPVRIFDL